MSKEYQQYFLSGGIDSSAVLAIAARQFSGTRLKTYSIHFGPDYPNENEYIQMMVDQYQTDHHWLEVKPKDFLADLANIIHCLDEPVGDPITVPNFILAKVAASQGSGDLVLNGEGGDPCFGGPKNVPMMLSSIYSLASPEDSFKSSLEYNYLVSYKKCFEDLSRLLHPDLYNSLNVESALVGQLEPYFRGNRPTRFINKLMVANMRLKGAHLILPKVDKMSSANGVLALAPLYTSEIMRTSMQLHPLLKFKNGIEKYPLKASVADIVPAPIIERPKSGMMVPVRYWFRKEMHRYAKRLLSSQSIQQLGWINPDYVKWIQKCNIDDLGGLRTGLKLWMLLTLVHWHEVMVKGNCNYSQSINFKSINERNHEVIAERF